MPNMIRMACAVALLLLLAAPAKAGPIEMLQWGGGTFTNETGNPANDFDVRVRFRSPTTFSGPTTFMAPLGPFDKTDWSFFGGSAPRMTAIYSFNKFNFVNADSSITLGGFKFLGDLSDVVGVDIFWTVDGNRSGDYIPGGRITRVPEPASLALLGVGLLGLLMTRPGALRRRARPQPARALDEGGDLGHALARA